MIRTGNKTLALHPITPDQMAAARQRIASAEADLGKLSDGQRRDLLKDNLPWDGALCHAAVEAIATAEARAVILPGNTPVMTDDDVAYVLYRDRLGNFTLQRLQDGATLYLQGEDATKCQEEIDAIAGALEFDRIVTRFRLWADAFSELLDADKAERVAVLEAEEEEERPTRCQHRDTGRGVCADCGVAL